MPKKIIILLLLIFISHPIFSHAKDRVRPGSISIIIDDMGYDDYVIQKFLDIDLPIAFSFIPQTPGVFYAKKFYEKGYTVMIHMPSEPINKKLKGGPLELKIDEGNTTIRSKLETAYVNLSFASGFNNHMGSKFLQSNSKMEVVIQFLKDKHLFFIDSLTTPRSVGSKLACKMHLPYAVRDLFIDNKKNLKFVIRNLQLAVLLAKEGKTVIAIGHCNIVDFEAIKHTKEELKPYLKDIKDNLKVCQ